MTEERMAVLETQMVQVIANQGRYEEEAREWRGRFCSKLDRVLERLDNRPCEIHAEKFTQFGKDIGWLQKIVYTLLTLIVPSIIGVAVVWGALNNDVTHLKSTSYGYRGIKVVTDDGAKV